MYDDQVAAVVGPQDTECTYGIQPLAYSAHMPIVAYGSVSAGVSDKPFLLRTMPSHKDQMLMMAAMAVSIHVKHLAEVYDSYWDRDIPPWVKILSKNGLKHIGSARMCMCSFDTSSLDKQLDKLAYDTSRC